MQPVTERFSDRVANYVKYRPTYPTALITTLQTETGLTPAHVIADIGAGTGISSALFLAQGNTVYGVEPNAGMREAAEVYLAPYPNFHAVAATAEATTLADASVGYVTAGQAFHWFDHPRAKTEFQRILQPNGWVALFWNDRKTDTTPFLRAYEELLLTYGTDYTEINHRNITDDPTARFRDFFANGTYQSAVFPNHQTFDYEGVKGRLLSSSYAPNVGQPNYEPMLALLERIFTEHQENGQIVFEYETQLFFGHV
jgi:SAM-dependent methyltransferase